jgi:hypothetical protein
MRDEIREFGVFSCVSSAWKLILCCSCLLAVQFFMTNSYVPLTLLCFGCVFILKFISIIVLFIIVLVVYYYYYYFVTVNDLRNNLLKLRNQVTDHNS